MTDAGVAQQFGLAVYGLRTAFVELRLDERHVRFGQVLELHAPGDALPAGWRWAARAELAHARLDQPLSQAVDALLGELEQGCVPAVRPPWARPGWLAGAERWIRQQLDSLGLTQQGSKGQRTYQALERRRLL